MDKISFEEIGSLLVTFHAENGVKQGQVVKVSKNGTVAPCAAGEAFCGVAQSGSGSAVGVQVEGFVQVGITGTVALGWVSLTADGTGGVQTTGKDQSGIDVLVVDVDTAGGTAVIRL